MQGLGIENPQEKLINEFECEGCYEKVQQKTMVIPIGPRKGEVITVNQGCKCADIELSRQAIKLSEKLKTKKMQRFFNDHSLINQSLQKATLENYEPISNELAMAKEKVTNYIDNFNGVGNLLLHGTYGTGKSHLSISVAKKVMEKGYNSLFLSLPKLLTKIRDTYKGDGMTEDQLLNHIQSVDLLILDDLGAENQTEWSVSKLFEIMDGRAGKSTIYTTNLSSKELKEQMNERNFSRILENTEVIMMNGKDYRRRKF